MGTENLSSKSDLIQFGFHQLIETIAEASSMSLDELENTLIEESIFRFFSNPKIFLLGILSKLSFKMKKGNGYSKLLLTFWDYKVHQVHFQEVSWMKLQSRRMIMSLYKLSI